MRRLALLPALLTAFMLAACGAGATPSPAASAPTAGSAAPAAASGGGGGGAACAAAAAGASGTVTVTIKNFAFSPQPVQAKVGDVVTWSNQDTAPHTATLDNGACSTDPINPGSSASLVFNTPGTYTYHCKIHPTQMKGYTIVVS
jgi:plastocyanin